jgi:hypothetical protein
MNDVNRVSNVEVLKEAGLIRDREGLHEDYDQVFEDLSDEEMAVLVLLKARLDAVMVRGAPSWEAHLPL